MSALLRDVAREPLLHFLIVGAALFGLDAAIRSDDSAHDEGERRIVVDAGVRAELRDGWAHAHGAPPSDAELEALVARWIDEEILYREGLARGLDQGDPRVRARVASSMSFVLRSEAVVPAPSERELRAFFDAHAELWAEQALVDFTHVFVEGDDDEARARADELLAQVRAGASPNGLGDTFSGGRRYRRRRIAQLAESFGEGFARAIETQAERDWELLRSRFGLHVVRVDARSAARAADFETARADVVHAWTEARQEEEVARAIERLRGRWEIATAP